MGEEFSEDIDLASDVKVDVGDFELSDIEESIDIPENIGEDVWNEGEQEYVFCDENLIDELPEDVYENWDIPTSDMHGFDVGENIDETPNEIQEDIIENTDTETPYEYEFSGYETHEFPEVENPKVLRRENNYQEDIIDEVPEDTNIEDDVACTENINDVFEDISSEAEGIDSLEENSILQEQNEAEEFLDNNDFEDGDTENNSEILHNDVEMQDEVMDKSTLEEEISADADDNQEYSDGEVHAFTENDECVEENIFEDTETPAESVEVQLNEIDEETEFSVEELQENINRTPINNGEWNGERGESTWIPEDESVRETIGKYGADGIEYHNGIPDFDKFSAFDIELNEDEFTEKNSHQFTTCNEGLADYFSDLSDQLAGTECEDPLENSDYRNAMMNIFKCDESELEDIQLHLNEYETPYGFTWHHSQIPGRMQLIPTEIHVSARHRGGQSIWGGGAANR